MQRQLRSYTLVDAYSSLIKRLEVVMRFFVSLQPQQPSVSERLTLYQAIAQKEAPTRAEQLALTLYIRELQTALKESECALGVLKTLSEEGAEINEPEKTALEKIIDTLICFFEKNCKEIRDVVTTLSVKRLPTRYKETIGAPASGVFGV